MKPYAVRQFQLPQKELVSAATRERAKPKSLAEVHEAAQRATRLSLYQNPAAAFLWSDVVTACADLSIDAHEIIFQEDRYGVTRAEHVLSSEDWLSSREMSRALKDGLYADGRVIKTGEFFARTTDEPGRWVGIKATTRGDLYGGGIRNGMRSGFGVQESSVTNLSYGNWFDDKMNGVGCQETGVYKKIRKEGLYAQGVLVQPRRAKSLWESIRSLVS
jgi:hypothetical protein